MLESNLVRGGNPHDDGHQNSAGEDRARGSNAMAVVMPVPVQADWVKTMLFDRGYLSRIRGEAIKVYLVIIEACNGFPDRSVTISLSQLMKRTRLSCPTVIDSLARLEELGLVVSTTHERGKVKTYYVPGPSPGRSA
jgi:Bacterial regulatory protein, arsR family